MFCATLMTAQGIFITPENSHYKIFNGPSYNFYYWKRTIGDSKKSNLKFSICRNPLVNIILMVAEFEWNSEQEVDREMIGKSFRGNFGPQKRL